MRRLKSGNRVTLLECGQQFFPALIRAIDSARSEVHLETYIFARDPSGELVAAALTRAAARGVVVRLMVDGFGGREFVDQMLPRLVEAGVDVLIYRREIGALTFRRHRLRRLHRKIAVIDGATAFIGGINIIDDEDTPGQIPPRFDYAVEVQGPVLGEIHTTVHRLWWMLSWASLRRRPPWHSAVTPRTEAVGSQRAGFLVRDNLRHRRDIEDAYLAAIGRARSEVVIACAYFFPGYRFRQALTEAAQRGVRVVLLLQGRVEYLLLHYATHALYPNLLSGGVRIFEYHRSFLHAKVAVIDRHWATVGSSNIDPFSLLLSREANLVVRDPGFATELHASLARAIAQGARELKTSDWKHAGRLHRAASWLAYGTVRLTMGLLGIGGRS